MWANVSLLAWNAGYMFGKSNVRIANSILEGNLPFTVDDQLWRTGLVMSFMFLGDKHLWAPIMLYSVTNVQWPRILQMSLKLTIWCLIFLQRRMCRRLTLRVSMLFLIRPTPIIFYTWTITLSSRWTSPCSNHPLFVLRMNSGLKRMLISLTKFWFFRKRMLSTQTHSSMLNQCISLTRRNMWTRRALLTLCPDLMPNFGGKHLTRRWTDWLNAKCLLLSNALQIAILSEQQWSTSIRSIVSKTLSLANVVCVFGEIGKRKASISSNTKPSVQFLIVGRIEFFIR